MVLMLPGKLTPEQLKLYGLGPFWVVGESRSSQSILGHYWPLKTTLQNSERFVEAFLCSPFVAFVLS